MSPSVQPTRQRNVFTEAVFHVLTSDQNCKEVIAKVEGFFIGISIEDGLVATDAGEGGDKG